MKVLMVDNYDSFTFNLVHLLEELGAEVAVRRNDEVSTAEARQMGLTHLVVSPGPGRPEEAGVAVELVKALGPTLPTLGVCLGHQAIVVAFGGKVGLARTLVHGKSSPVDHDGKGIFNGLPARFDAGRYHSLAATRLPDALAVSATDPAGEVMAVRHRDYPIDGVQFHPESVLTLPLGREIMRNFLEGPR